MSEANNNREFHAVGKRLSELSPEEFIALIDGVCAALEESDLAYHGGVNASNISMDENGDVRLGDAAPEDTTGYTASQIEYIAPEVFWDNERSTQADIYSVGMLMYAWSNGGCLPFLYPDATASDRAEALRRKMSGESFEKSPVSETLNGIIEKAAAFKAADRYASVSDLHDAFSAFRAEAEEQGFDALSQRLAVLKAKQLREASIMANILAAAEAAAGTGTAEQPIKTIKTKKQAKQKEPVKQEEKKKMSLRPLIAVLLIAAILMVAAVAMQFGEENTTLNNPNATPAGTPVIPTADPSATPDITPFIDITPNIAETSPSLTDDPILVPTPTPTVAPIVTIDTSRYSVVKADVSWNTAAENCIANGGNLVTINDKDEFAGLTALADKHGLECVWVGGFRKSGNIVWLSGQTSDYIPWANGQPSYRDGNGNQENFLMLVKNNGIWEYNDVVDNPAAYSGRIGYIMEK